MNPGATTVTRDQIKEALGDLYDWYQSDEHEDRPITDILKDIAADLQRDRSEALLFQKIRREIDNGMALLGER